MNYSTYDRLIRELVERYTDIEIRLIYEIVKILSEINTDVSVEEFIKLLDNQTFINQPIINIINEIDTKAFIGAESMLNEVSTSFLDLEPLQEAYNLGIIALSPYDVNFDRVLKKHYEGLDKEIKRIKKKVRQGIYKDTYVEVKKAQLNVELGVLSPEKAIIEATKSIVKKGITSDTYLREGKEVNQGLEGVVRRAVRTSFTETANAYQEEIAKELGTTHFYVSQHIGARVTKFNDYTNHAYWQGKVYSNEELVTELGEGEIQGFGGINCRHIKRPFIIGVSLEPPPLLNMKELERVYALTQKQRLYERNIRKTKTEINALSLYEGFEDGDIAIKQSKARLRQQQKRLREFIKENDDVLRRDYTRERVVDVN